MCPQASSGIRLSRPVTGGTECNDPVPFVDVTNMRNATAAVGAAFVLATASIAVGQPTASAEPAAPQVKYTLTSAGPGDFNLYYAIASPPSLEAYHADPNAYVKSEKINLAPGAPWEFTPTLTDSSWAFVSASGAAHAMQADPNIRCQITVDGQIVDDKTGPFTTQCQLRPWN